MQLWRRFRSKTACRLLSVLTLTLPLSNYLVAFALQTSLENLAWSSCKLNHVHQQFGTKKLVLAECYHFYSYKQLEGQSLSEYIVKLRHLAARCNLSAEQLEDNIHNKFMMGLQNERLLQQLLTQDHKKPLDDLVEFARVFKAAEHESLTRADFDKRSDSTVTANKPSKSTGRTRVMRKAIATKRPAQNAGRNQLSSHYACCGGDHEHPRSTCVSAMLSAINVVSWGIIIIARVCCLATAAVHNQPLESAVVTVNKSSCDKDIPQSFNTSTRQTSLVQPCRLLLSN